MDNTIPPSQNNSNPKQIIASEPQYSPKEVPQPVIVLSCIQRATNMVDNITDSLYTQIINGFQIMSKRRKMKETPDANSPINKKSLIPQKTIDIDLHKRMIRKFMRMNRRSIRSIEQHSIEFQEEVKKQKEIEINKRNEQKSKTLQVRRQKISQKLKSKEKLKEEIKKMAQEGNKKFEAIKSTKFLYQERQEAFKRDVILPKIQEEKRILSKIKEERGKPINITQILQHQKLYEQKRMNDKLNRSLTSRVLQNQNFYEAPKFVSKAYIIAQTEKQIREQQQKLKEQALQINQYRKKEFIKIMQEKQRQEMERIKQASLQRSRSNKTFSVEGEQANKKKPKVELNREEIKNVGNEYLKQLINLNRMHKSKQNIAQLNAQASLKSNEGKPRSEYEIELIKEERIEKVQKIRLKKIENILNSSSIDKDLKLYHLNNESQKFDQLLSLQPPKSTDELASIVLSSIHTKLAILEVNSPKNQ